MRIVIIGAGGHSHVMTEALLEQGRRTGDVHVAGLLDENASLHGSSVLGRPVLGDLARLPDIPHDAVVVAVGDNQVRLRLMRLLADRGETFAVARHPSALLATDVAVAPGAQIAAGVVVTTGVRVGRGAILNTGAIIEHDTTVGECAHVAPGVVMGGGVTIGSLALVGLGARVIPGVTIGPGAVVGAGTVVIDDVPAQATCVGVPGRIVRRPLRGIEV